MQICHYGPAYRQAGDEPESRKGIYRIHKDRFCLFLMSCEIGGFENDIDFPENIEST